MVDVRKMGTLQTSNRKCDKRILGAAGTAPSIDVVFVAVQVTQQISITTTCGKLCRRLPES